MTTQGLSSSQDFARQMYSGQVQMKRPHFWSDSALPRLLNVMRDLRINRFVNIGKYGNTDLFKKILERMKEGGCVQHWGDTWNTKFLKKWKTNLRDPWSHVNSLVGGLSFVEKWLENFGNTLCMYMSINSYKRVYFISEGWVIVCRR